MQYQKITLVFFFALMGCSTGPTTTRALSYSVNAKKNYHRGVRALRKKQFEEAKKYFTYVRSHFVLSKYVVLAELRLADLLFKQGKYLSAMDAYQNFIKEHPHHRNVLSGYVPFRVGYCQWKMAPSGWWLMPPTYEKDLTPAQGAMKVFRLFLKRFPDSKYSRRARRYYRKAVRMLARHEMYVARFYLSRNKPKGAILRLKGLIKRYPDAGYESSVMLLLGKTYLKLGQVKQATHTFTQIIGRHPNSPNASRARLYVRFINHRYRPR